MKKHTLKNRWGLLVSALTWVFFAGQGHSQNCAPVTNLQSSIANAIYDNNHAIKLTWTAVSGATQYNVETSQDGINYGNTVTVTGTSFIHNAFTSPNIPYWFRVRVAEPNNSCNWTNSEDPIYTSAALPADIIATVSGTNIDLTLRDETPYSNPNYTRYAVFCTNNNQYVQADGTFGPNAVYITKDEWEQISITDASENTTYCFNSRVINENGNIRKGVGSNIMPTQTFNSNNLTIGGTASTTSWFAPNSHSPITWTPNGNCSGGAIGFNGSFNNFWGNFIRLPQQDCSTSNTITTAFTLSHSYAANATNNYFRFYIWADNGYKNVVSNVAINGTNLTTDNQGKFFFNEARTCANVEVTFDLNSINNRSNILIYLEAFSAYNNSTPFWFYLDDIVVNDSQPATTCVTTTLGVNSFNNAVNIYPNPTNNVINIHTQESITAMTVFNIVGQKVAENRGMTSIAMDTLPAGNYIVKVTLANGTVTTHKITKI